MQKFPLLMEEYLCSCEIKLILALENNTEKNELYFQISKPSFKLVDMMIT